MAISITMSAVGGLWILPWQRSGSADLLHAAARVITDVTTS